MGKIIDFKKYKNKEDIEFDKKWKQIEDLMKKRLKKE